MATVRAKFRVSSITQFDNGVAREIKLSAQYDQSIPEDRRFSEATPSGSLTMYVNNPAAIAQFEIGKSYYLDFTPAE